MAAQSTPKLSLLYFPGACSVAPHIVLQELGIPFEIEAVDRSDEGQARWAKLNPKMKVPVLTMDEEIITEIPAIMTALAQLDPSRNLLGKSNIETVRVYEWMNWLSGTLHSQIWGRVFRPGRFADDPSTHDAITQSGLQAAKDFYGAIETKLTGDYAVGDGFTVVDPYLYVFYRWAAGRDVVTAETHPKYTKLVTNVAKRTSVAKVIEAEGIKPIPA